MKCLHPLFVTLSVNRSDGDTYCNFLIHVCNHTKQDLDAVAGGSKVSTEPPFLPRLLEILVWIEPPFLTNSKKILTVAHLRVFLGDFCSNTCCMTEDLEPRSKMGVANAKVCVTSKISRALCARLLYRNPPS